MNAPVVVASGYGEFAEAILKEAMASHIPVYQSGPLAREMVEHAKIGDVIAERFYVPCAKILHWAYQQHRSGRDV